MLHHLIAFHCMFLNQWIQSWVVIITFVCQFISLFGYNLADLCSGCLYLLSFSLRITTMTALSCELAVALCHNIYNFYHWNHSLASASHYILITMPGQPKANRVKTIIFIRRSSVKYTFNKVSFFLPFLFALNSRTS